MKWKMITCCKMKQVLKQKDFEKLVDDIRVGQYRYVKLLGYKHFLMILFLVIH